MLWLSTIVATRSAQETKVWSAPRVQWRWQKGQGRGVLVQHLLRRSGLIESVVEERLDEDNCVMAALLVFDEGRVRLV